ncbi:hypothetical protein [Thermorudis peleae]|uniref:hypothetical protein n=1 Tax=Thermorudis peleae TaxID=1382356 RepID=UPI001E6574B2|nr:hypothetical protein [Thermorudis peleae]
MTARRDGTRPQDLFDRGHPFQPKAKSSAPRQPGSWLVTIRSVPFHHDEIKQAIESTGDARVYFSETLAYLKGQAVSLFRIEATGLQWVDTLWRWWQTLQRRSTIPFDIAVYINNTELLARFSETTPEQIKTLIRERAPRYQPFAALES